MSKESTHLLVPTGVEQREACLGPHGSTAHVTRLIQMVQGRWKLLVLFQLYADPSVCSLQLRRDLQGISQKVLTQQLRELIRLVWSSEPILARSHCAWSTVSQRQVASWYPSLAR